MTTPRLQNIWPPILVLVFAVVLALQIPYTALFPVSVAEPPSETFVSFLKINPSVYTGIVQRVRMSWQVRSENIQVESRLEPIEIAELREPLQPLAFDQSFLQQAPVEFPPSPYHPPVLLPSSLAAPELEPGLTVRPVEVTASRHVGDELLPPLPGPDLVPMILPPPLQTPFQTEQQPQ